MAGKEAVALVPTMKGGNYYNENSSWQEAAQKLMMPAVKKAAETCTLPSMEGLFVIADLGCSEGRNSVAPVEEILRAIRHRAPDLAIQVLHEDLPETDYTVLFKTIFGPASYLQHFDNVFPVALGRSYYERLAPPGQLSLVLAFVTLHFLPVTSGERLWGPEAWHQFHPKVAAGLGKRKAEEAMTRFLSLRAEECAPGGKLVLSMVGRDEMFERTGHAPRGVDFFGDALLAAAAAVGAAQPELTRMQMPIYRRSLEELQETLLLPELEKLYEVELIRQDAIIHPVVREHEDGRPLSPEAAATLARAWLAVMEPMGLSLFAAADRSKVQAVLPEHLRTSLLAATKPPLWLFGEDETHLFVVLKRRPASVPTSSITSRSSM